MRVMEVSVFVRDTCQLGEGPFWFEDRLWWVDIEAGKLHSVNGSGGDRASLSMGRRIGAVAPIDAEHFLVALEDGIGIFHRASGVIDLLAAPEKNQAGSRFNDGKCDAAGRFVAGTLNMAGRTGASALYSIGCGGAVEVLHAPATISNGLAWSADGATLYYIDSPTREIAAFPYDQETGRLGARSVVVRVPDAMGLPDGMDIDREGNLWVGHWGGNAVRCWSPRTGECLAEVPVPCSQVTSCCFGGPEWDLLYITTARVGLNEEQLRQEPLAGSLFVCQPGVSGFPVKKFERTPSVSVASEQ